MHGWHEESVAILVIIHGKGQTIALSPQMQTLSGSDQNILVIIDIGKYQKKNNEKPSGVFGEIISSLNCFMKFPDYHSINAIPSDYFSMKSLHFLIFFKAISGSTSLK
jgi:hypothetical protein